MATSDSLEEQASQFAQRLTTTVQAVAPFCSPFQATAIPERVRFRVRQDPDTGIPLTVDGAAILTLKASYDCTLDGVGQYLAVDGSKVAVHAGAMADREPLFRYEYIRNVQSDIPSAHIQIHAHRDAITYVMARAGEGTRRGKDRQQSSSVPKIAELHFPLGGHRFRPCLEDILEMLVTELGVDCTDDGRGALRRGREDWRRSQTRAVVRDAPAEAISVLRALGYDINIPDALAEPPGNPDRLKDF